MIFIITFACVRTVTDKMAWKKNLENLEKKKSPTDSNKTSSHHSSDVGSLTGEICCLPFILKLLTPPMDDSSTARPFPAHSIFSHLCTSLLPIL